MKFRIEYSFGREWHKAGEFETMFEAKKDAAGLKRHVGKCGKIRIVKVN